MKSILIIFVVTLTLSSYWLSCSGAALEDYGFRHSESDETTPTPDDPGSKPPLVLMQSPGSRGHKVGGTGKKQRPVRSIAAVGSTSDFCEDTENPCTCCCINCWEYGITKRYGSCYRQCSNMFSPSCDCKKLILPDYD